MFRSEEFAFHQIIGGVVSFLETGGSAVTTLEREFLVGCSRALTRVVRRDALNTTVVVSA